MVDCSGGISFSSDTQCRFVFEATDQAAFVIHGGGITEVFTTVRRNRCKVASVQLLIVTDTMLLSLWPCVVRVQTATRIATAIRFLEERNIYVPSSNTQLWPCRRTPQITDAAPVVLGMKLERHRGVRCICFVRRH